MAVKSVKFKGPVSGSELLRIDDCQWFSLEELLAKTSLHCVDKDGFFRGVGADRFRRFAD